MSEDDSLHFGFEPDSEAEEDAIAHEAGVEFDLDMINEVSAKVPAEKRACLREQNLQALSSPMLKKLLLKSI